MKTIIAVSITVLLGACTHASISSIPIDVPGIGKVYKYEGRANFAHQRAEADRMMIEHCKSLNGGSPEIVNIDKRDLGVVATTTGNSTTSLNASVTSSPYSNQAQLKGAATTNTIGTTTALRNMNQEILYRCVK